MRFILSYETMRKRVPLEGIGLRQSVTDKGFPNPDHRARSHTAHRENSHSHTTSAHFETFRYLPLRTTSQASGSRRRAPVSRRRQPATDARLRALHLWEKGASDREARIQDESARQKLIRAPASDFWKTVSAHVADAVSQRSVSVRIWHTFVSLIRYL